MGRPPKLTPTDEAAQSEAIAAVRRISRREQAARARAEAILDEELKPEIRAVLALRRSSRPDLPLVPEELLSKAIDRPRSDLRRWKDERGKRSEKP
jgi:hypothetical protein